MALPKVEQVELQYMDTWFSNLVDNLNYDIGQIQASLADIDPPENFLNTIDTSPIQYLRSSLQRMVNTLNEAFREIEERLGELESKRS